jgi:hypothetical protein
MPSPTLDDLKTPANGQIFVLNGPLTDAAIHVAFTTASTVADGQNVAQIVRERRTSGALEYWASFVCFPVRKPPAFLPQTQLIEETFAFLLILEMEVGRKWHLGIFKHGGSSIGPWIESVANPLPRRQLTNAFSSSSAVPRLSVKRITASRYELYGASYEGSDLQDTAPMLAASRSVIRTVHFRDPQAHTYGVTVSTSRVQRSGGRCAVSELATLVNEVAKKSRANKKSAFLSSFAQAVEISELPANCQPTSVLFDWTNLLDDGDLQLYRTPGRGEPISNTVPKEFVSRLLGEPLLVNPDGAEWIFGPPNAPRGTISLTKTRFSVPSILRNKVVVHNFATTDTMPLTRWVRENEHYKITFSHPSFAFVNGILCRRADFQQEVDLVRRALHEEPSLSAATSEKGKPARTATTFPPHSIFHAVETAIYPNHRWLCCLDLGDEWADFLCVENDNIIFVHCKHGHSTTSASVLHEVIGQALKNLSRAQGTPAEFSRKFSASRNTRYWANSRIRRLRGPGARWNPFERDVTELIGRPTAGREVHVVQTMLSKGDFDAAAVSPRPHFIQLVWLLASFISACREMAAKPVIICRP